jgi:hypothetical protein
VTAARTTRAVKARPPIVSRVRGEARYERSTEPWISCLSHSPISSGVEPSAAST